MLKIICSAVRFKEKVWYGHRHGNALDAMHSQLSYYMNRREMHEQQTDRDQGFITNEGTYVNREEAWIIALAANQIIAREHQNIGTLYSEDLY